MPKYEILERKMNARKDKHQIRVAISDQESAFFNFPVEPSPERVDAEVDLFLAARELEAAKDKFEKAKQDANIA